MSAKWPIARKREYRLNPARHLYKTARWQALRAAQLATYPLCQQCEKLGHITPATVADHVEPHRGDPEKFWTVPIQSLCATCHNSAKQSEEKGGLGFRKGSREDGFPLDPGHHWYNRGE